MTTLEHTPDFDESWADESNMAPDLHLVGGDFDDGLSAPETAAWDDPTKVELDEIDQELTKTNSEQDDADSDAVLREEMEAARRQGKSELVDLLQFVLDSAGKRELLKPHEEVELAKQIEAGGEAGKRAKDLMIESNLRLVVSIVKKFRGHGVDFEDLIQDGALGLIRGVEKFDWRKGYKLSTYVTWWIKQAAQRSIANKSRTIRVPVHVHDRLLAIHRVERLFLRDYGIVLTDEELASEMNLTVQQIKEAKAGKDIQPVSMNALVGDGDEDKDELGLVVDFSQSRYADHPSGTALEAEGNLNTLKFYESLEKLPDLLRETIVHRFGIGGHPPKTLAEVGKELGVAIKSVRGLEVEALKMLGVNESIDYSERLTTRPAREKKIAYKSPEGETVKISKKEYEIALLLGKNLTNPQISQLMGISESSVKHFVGTVKQSLKVTSRADAGEKAADLFEVAAKA